MLIIIILSYYSTQTPWNFHYMYIKIPEHTVNLHIVKMMINKKLHSKSTYSLKDAN